MAVLSVLIALQASFGDGRNISESDFIKCLTIAGEDPIEGTTADRGNWASSCINFSIVRLSDFSTEDEPHEAMSATLMTVLNGVSSFLNRQSVAAFEDFQSRELKVNLLVDVRMDEDQMEFDLPSGLIASCGRLGLGIYMISNDISAAEALELGIAEY